MRSPVFAALGIGLLAPAPLPAQGPAPVEVLIVGTYHFANPGLDAVKVTVADVLHPTKQQEIGAIVDGLARFRPTKVAVEARPERAARLDSLYAAYRAGSHALTRDETQQLGFRLAARFDHPRVHPVDHAGEFPFGELMAWAGQHDTAFVTRVQSVMGSIQAEHNRWQQELTIGEFLRRENDPARIAWSHGLYVDMNRVGAGEGWAGSKVVAAWYERNLAIFANLQRLAEPGDRILLIIGAAHLGTLRAFVRDDPRMRLVDPLPFLTTEGER